MFGRHRWSIVAVLALLAVLVLLGRWQPARQVRAHTESQLAAVEKKDWKRLEKLIADDYSDPWGQDKTVVQQRLKEVFAQFFVTEIKAGEIAVEETDGQGIAKSRITLVGRGTPIAEMAIQRASTLSEPFTFTWRQQSWKPWDWALTRVEQPELKLEAW